MRLNSDSETDPQNNVAEIKKSGSILGVLVSLLLIIAVSLIAFVVYLKSEGYDFSSLNIKDAIAFINSENDKAKKLANSEISFSQEGNVDCKLYRDYTIVLSKDSLGWYARDGKLLQEKPITLIRPVIRTSNKYMAIVDISGRDIYFYKDKSLLWSRKLENQIINADISDDGYCTVVTQSKEYKSAVQVIDINGADKYTKMCAEDLVVSAKAIHNGEDVLINKINTNSIKTGTQFEFNNIYEEKPFSKINVADSIFPIIMTYGDNELAVSRNSLIFMDKQGKESWRKNADSIYCVVPNSDKYIIAAGAFSSNTGTAKQKIIVLNTKGQELYSFEQPENITGMHLYKDRIALRTQRSVYLYTLKGKKLGQYSARNELKDAYLIGENEVAVISGGNISIVQIQ